MIDEKEIKGIIKAYEVLVIGVVVWFYMKKFKKKEKKEVNLLDIAKEGEKKK